MPGSHPAAPVVGLDVGGANTKAALVDGDGSVHTASEPFELWREPDALAPAVERVLAAVAPRGMDGAGVALTMTAELADVWTSKREGVLAVIDAVRSALPGRALTVLRTDGSLVAPGVARRDPLRCAAANWMATAQLVSRTVPDAVLVDCGSTTTDVIPIAGGAVVAHGRTDLERLRCGELVYTGALRTNLAAVLSSVTLDGQPCPVASECFAVSADAHLLLGSVTPDRCSGTFPDGRGAASVDVARRLARVVCAEPDELGEAGVRAIAAAAADAQTAAIAAALDRVAAGREVVTVGVGAFLTRGAARRCGLRVRELDEHHPLAGAGSDVAAAVALSVLGRER